jgi:hypothetical protein
MGNQHNDTDDLVISIEKFEMIHPFICLFWRLSLPNLPEVRP